MNETRLELLYKYCPYSIDRNIDRVKIFKYMKSELLNKKSYIFKSKDSLVTFYYSLHDWETSYFCINSIFLFFVDYKPGQIKIVSTAIIDFIAFLREQFDNRFILSMEIPVEDIELIQILNNSRFRTIETRLHFLHNNLDKYDYPRYNIRDVQIEDLPNLKNVAKFMRNSYDRFHSDWSFKNEQADEYLATYIENSILGFADFVITSNENNLPSDSFLTANALKDMWTILGYPISKMVLGAVSSRTNKGWLIKLISEMTYKLRDIGAKGIFMNSQATNIAVLISWEKLGYRIGRVTHLLTLNSND